MTIKDIYAISEISNINEFAHFMFALLIPLLYYDIQTKHSHTLNIKINVFKFEHILKEIFNKRIMFNYINTDYNVVQIDKNYYWDLYINLLKNKEENIKNNIILLPAFDSLVTRDNKYINKNIIPNQTALNNYEKQYVDFYSGNNESQLNKNVFNQIKEKYKVLHYTDNYFKLIMYKKSIDRFLHNIYGSPTHKYKIILIERPYKPFINNSSSFFLNTSGQRRTIYNHNELKNTITKLFQGDVLNVSLDNLTFEQQYHLFKNAKIIIGQQGAGLCNMFFSKPNFKSHIIEISPKWSPNNTNFFKNIAEICEINYYNVKQPKMTMEEWTNFSVKYNINYPKITNNEWENFSNIDYFNFNDKYYVIKSFIANSGSVNIDTVVNIIKNIL